MSVTLIWDVPTTREDGSILPLDEIDHYEMQYNGSFYSLVAKDVSELNIGSTLGTFRIRCCDVYEKCSIWSNELVIDATKGNPDAPGQLRRKK